MSRPVLYSIIFFAVYAVSLFVMLPASFVVEKAEQRFPQLITQGVSGSAWSGELQALQFDGKQLRNIQWQLSPLALLIGEVDLDLLSVSDQQSIEGTLNMPLSGDEFALSDLRVRFPIANYAQQLGVADFDLAGQIDFQLSEMELKEGKIVNAQGVMYWHQAEAAKTVKLGDIQADWKQTEGRLEATLSDSDSPLKIDGDFTLESTGIYQFEALLTVKDESDVALKQTLALLGRKVSENKVKVAKRGRIAMPAWLRLQ